MNLPLTIKAFEFGKSLTMLGGRPICNAFSKSAALTAFVPAMMLPPLARLDENYLFMYKIHIYTAFQKYVPKYKRLV
jgi:hypothetical protein